MIYWISRILKRLKAAYLRFSLLLAIQSLSGNELHNGLQLNLSTSSNTTNITLSSWIFKETFFQKRPIVFKTPQNVHTAHANPWPSYANPWPSYVYCDLVKYVVNSSRVVPVQANHSITIEYLWTSDRPKKQASAKAVLLTFATYIDY